MNRKWFIVYFSIITLLVLNINLVYGSSDLRAGMHDIILQIIGSMDMQNKEKLAVMDFKDKDQSPSKIGSYFSAAIIDKLLKVNKFQVIRKNRLDSALNRIGLSERDVLDSDTIIEMERILGIDSLLVGNIIELDNTLEIDARLISTKTTKEFDTVTTEVAKDEEIIKLMGQTENSGVGTQANRHHTFSKRVLRSSPSNDWNAVDIKEMVIENDFFEHEHNPEGRLENKFEVKIINKVRVIVDKATGLMWYQGGSDSLDYPGALAYISKLNQTQSAGFSNWRLPTTEEAASLLSPDKVDRLYINPIFNKKQNRIWTCDCYSANGAWGAYFQNGRLFWGFSFSSGYYVRPVRSEK